MVELEEVAVDVQVLLAELPMVELDEVAEGVREPIDHPHNSGTVLNRFVFAY